MAWPIWLLGTIFVIGVIWSLASTDWLDEDEEPEPEKHTVEKEQITIEEALTKRMGIDVETPTLSNNFVINQQFGIRFADATTTLASTFEMPVRSSLRIGFIPTDKNPLCTDEQMWVPSEPLPDSDEPQGKCVPVCTQEGFMWFEGFCRDPAELDTKPWGVISQLRGENIEFCNGNGEIVDEDGVLTCRCDDSGPVYDPKTHMLRSVDPLNACATVRMRIPLNVVVATDPQWEVDPNGNVTGFKYDCADTCSDGSMPVKGRCPAGGPEKRYSPGTPASIDNYCTFNNMNHFSEVLYHQLKVFEDKIMAHTSNMRSFVIGLYKKACALDTLFSNEIYDLAGFINKLFEKMSPNNIASIANSWHVLVQNITLVIEGDWTKIIFVVKAVKDLFDMVSFPAFILCPFIPYVESGNWDDFFGVNLLSPTIMKKLLEDATRNSVNIYVAGTVLVFVETILKSLGCPILQYRTGYWKLGGSLLDANVRKVLKELDAN